MARIGTFTLRVNSHEREALAVLARRLERSQSDALRLLIREVGRCLEQPPQTNEPPSISCDRGEVER
jgi:hypothetical protein